MDGNGGELSSFLTKLSEDSQLQDAYARDPQGTMREAGLSAPGKPRRETYAEMVEELLAPVRAGHNVCAAFYGHPGVFVNPGHEAIRRARAEGFPARMLPAVSALDCLVADLGIDPAAT